MRDAVPFNDLRALHDEVREEIESAWRALVENSAFIGGVAVTAFEQSFGQYCDVAHAIGVGSGTDAIRIALQAVGVRRGDLILTVPHTFIGTVEGITQAGADPVFIDIDRVTYTMDVDLVERFVTKSCKVSKGELVERSSNRRVSCVLPVDIYGHPARLGDLEALARRYGLRLVEDACQAHGAKWQRRTCGSFGDAAAFSFYPGKNLGAMGEAGAITTRDGEIAERCRVLRDHGQKERYVHVTGEGSNARLDAMQAIVLSAKLKRLASWTEMRRQVAGWYDTALDGLNLITPHEASDARHVYHLYVVQVNERDRVREVLTARGVGTGLHYPIPLHLQQAYVALHHQSGDFPVSERLALNGLSLPMFPHMTREQVTVVASALEQIAALRLEHTAVTPNTVS